MVVLIDRVTDEQVRGVTERGEWAADRRGVGWRLKVSGMGAGRIWDGMGRVWIRRGREMGGENGRHVRWKSILS